MFVQTYLVINLDLFLLGLGVECVLLIHTVPIFECCLHEALAIRDLRPNLVS
jgi:hypothetical protein